MQEYIYIYGINPVVESLLNPTMKINKLYLLEKSKNNDYYLKLAQDRQLKVAFCSVDKMTALVKTNKHQNLVLEILKPQNYLLETITTQALQKSHPFLLVLDQISDPHNFGAILRTCDMFNVDGVIILDKRQVDINATVAKTSAGAFNYVPVCRVNNLTNAVEYLKKQGFWIYATSLTAKAQKVNELRYDTPVCLIVGNEGAGISPKLLKHSDFNLYIPTTGHLDSLNVSVASAILIYHIKMLQQ
ncbi:23S rRNA (guanosine(2251)-2'-O)-methyltransferase RlmB [Spiroplasma sp. SV19]|uniref:23S rRNA (guanosine(2251)-2'-O)-methyltransferase RlmB n=1 Tax=Spiroplasma sp. SV19 TaxID=2570468 RepID=UPI0024B7BC69|nr:23S rRNA (guanosine(2251)-2'-O)-methyltransferase RlmB [Spiroplasma sp. SV19]WHQ36944.1 23S rRNA (guanosine(2251)-2'-O)-methyltransferase RlmB [Spiroplasma sp. SV19]